jgi:hypothetical protein
VEAAPVAVVLLALVDSVHEQAARAVPPPGELLTALLDLVDELG